MCYKEFIADHVTFSQSNQVAGLVLLSHSNLSNVPAFEPLLCKWLEKAIAHRVIASLGKQKGRHNIGSCFIDKAVA